jgi:hypothetical protein
MDPRFRRSSESGFSLVEALVSLGMTVVLLIAILGMVDAGNRVGRAEMQVADVQQAVRGSLRHMARMTRMAGRGGLLLSTPASLISGGPAIEVRNDMGAGGGSREVASDLADPPLAVAGTDMLIVRGVFETPLYQTLTAAGTLVLVPDPGNPQTATTGALTITNPGPAGFPQDLTPLRDAINDDVPEALVLVSPLGGIFYAVVELNGAASDITGFPNQVTVAFNITSGTHVSDYRGLFPNPGGGLPRQFTSVSSIGILEEHRFYVREDFAIDGDATSEPTPRLSVARMFPNTETPHRGLAANAQQDVADDILDLQIALGFDSSIGGFFDQDADNTGADDTLIETADGANDDWLWNGAGDDETMPPWVGPWTTMAPRPELYLLRLSVLGRTVGRDRGYVSPPIAAIEDRAYSETVNPSTQAEREARMFRRKLLQTVIDLRNQ